jgi:aminodeoxyfutalosine synthase
MLRRIQKTVAARGRITPAEALWLLRDADLMDLAELASLRRRHWVGERAFYQYNFNVNHTNICGNKCKLCAFYRDDAKGYTLTPEAVREAVATVHARGVDEVHVVGGLNDKMPYAYYLDLVKAIKSVSSSIQIQGFTAVEIDFFAKLKGCSSLDVLTEFQAAGLDSLPGGGSEIFSERVRALICENKAPAEVWLRIHEEAHRLGMTSNATMLYGHVETDEEIIDHLDRLRRVQDRTGGFRAFVPLKFFPKNTDLGASGRGSSGVFDSRLLATARIFLDNFQHLKSLWMIYGYKGAQVGLAFGADDIGGTYFDETIVHAAGANTPKSLTESEICGLLQRAGRTPVKVNSCYQGVVYG